MEATIAINRAGFKTFEESTIATVDRLVMAASYWKVSDSALRSLVHLTALACGSDKVISMTLPAADLEELEARRLVESISLDSVVLL